MFKHQPVNKLDIKSVTKPKGRFYTIDENTKYPSITTILGSTGDKEWLNDWRNMLGHKKADKETKRCAVRGEAVHKLCEDYINNIENFKDNHIQSNIDLFNKLRFKLKKIDNVKAQEVALFSTKLEVAGRTDCIAEYNKVLSVIDFKTSNGIKLEENIEDYFLQGAFYAIAYNEIYDAHITQIVIMIGVEKSMVPQVFVKELNKELIIKLLTRIKLYKDNK